jgi:hypothetical protein
VKCRYFSTHSLARDGEVRSHSVSTTAKKTQNLGLTETCIFPPAAPIPYYSPDLSLQTSPSDCFAGPDFRFIIPAGLRKELSSMKNSPIRASLLAASVTVAALFAGAVGAAESNNPAITNPAITNLKELIATNRYQEAYTLAIQLMDELEGEPEFDFLFGLAAIETGRPNEAVFALERIAYNYPDQQRVKLELARALYLMNDLAGFRAMFSEVLATNPADNIIANIQVFIDLIDEREKSISGSFSW